MRETRPTKSATGHAADRSVHAELTLRGVPFTAELAHFVRRCVLASTAPGDGRWTVELDERASGVVASVTWVFSDVVVRVEQVEVDPFLAVRNAFAVLEERAQERG
jgi:hypothetical protein